MAEHPSTYAYPKIGKLSVGAIGKPEVTRVLDPIWLKKPETASRVRERIERILDWSKGRGYRTGENPARWRGHLDAVYPAPAKVRKVEHHAAVPIDDMPAVYARLCEAEGIAALAARFTILTAVRVSETTGATEPEFAKADIWSISAERMKSSRDHNVPLSHEAKRSCGWRASIRSMSGYSPAPGRPSVVGYRGHQGAAVCRRGRMPRCTVAGRPSRIGHPSARRSRRGLGNGPRSRDRGQDRGRLPTWRADGEAHGD